MTLVSWLLRRRSSVLPRLINTAATLALLVGCAASAQGILANGEISRGTILSPKESHAWTFEARKGDYLSVKLGEVHPTEEDTGFYPSLRLMGPDGALLRSHAGDEACEIHLAAPLSGTYSVAVSDGSSFGDRTGQYQLNLVRTPENFVVSPGDQGGALTNGAIHLAKIHVGDLDPWSFPANKGDYLSVKLGEVPEGEVDPGFYPSIWIVGPDGALLRSHAGDEACEIHLAAPLTGTYTVVVSDGSSFGDRTGQYQLHLVRTPESFVVPPGDQGGALTNGAIHQGAIHVGDLDPWSFSANKGDYLSIKLGEVPEGEVDPGFYPSLWIIGPDGALLRSHAGGEACEIHLAAPLTGTYTVVVSDGSSFGDRTGKYQLHLVQAPENFIVSAGDQGGALTNGVIHHGEIHVGDLDPWSFSANKGDYLLIKLGEVREGEVDPGFYPSLWILGPDGALLRSHAGDEACELNLAAPLTGTYTVVVSDGSSFGDRTGQYRIHFGLMPERFIVPAGDEGGLLSNSAPSTGAIHTGDLDLWYVDLVAGSPVTLVTRVTGGDWYPRMRLYAPDGTLVQTASDAAAPSIAIQASQTCRYVLVIDDGSSFGAATGRYELQSQNLPAQGRQLRVTSRSASTLALCWPSELANHVLQECTDLGSAIWRDLSTELVDSGLEVRARIAIGSEPGSRFYRLRPPASAR